MTRTLATGLLAMLTFALQAFELASDIPVGQSSLQVCADAPSSAFHDFRLDSHFPQPSEKRP
jgi:hypothetical protein